MTDPTLHFRSRPSATAYMLRALVPRVRSRVLPFPLLCARWRVSSLDRPRLARFLRLTGLPAKGPLPLPYPHVFTYPLQMVLLTHPTCPLPIWRVLQVRNHFLQHHSVPQDRALDVEARFLGERVLPKGLEVDVHVTVATDGAIAWEGLTTYYYRGRYGLPVAPYTLPATPAEPGPIGATWCTDPGGGFRFGTLSGDYNAIHYWGSYGRRFGFRGAFHHPHAVLGQCMARMPAREGAAQRLELWMKGPVYYGTQVGLAVRHGREGIEFSLTAAGEDRPALVGRWSDAKPGSCLLSRDA